MASILGTATAVNTSGSYEMIVYPCSGGDAIISEQFTDVATGSISHTITNTSLNVNLGSVLVQIRDYVNQSVLGSSACFTHNCSVSSSISGVSGSSTC